MIDSIFGKKPNKLFVSLITIDNFSLYIEDFSKFIIAENLNDSSDQNMTKSKISDYLKQTIKNTNQKIDLTKSFYLLLCKEFNKELTKTARFHEIICLKDPSAETIIAFIRLFYDFEGQLFVSLSDIQKQVVNKKAKPSILMNLLTSINTIKLSESTDVIFEKDSDCQDLIKKLFVLIDIFKKSIKYSLLEETNTLFISFMSFVSSNLFSSTISLFCDFLNDLEFKSVFVVINLDIFSSLCSEMSDYSLIRSTLLNIFIRFHSNCKDTSKLKHFKKYQQENNCIESIFSSIKNLANVDIDFIFNDLLKILLIDSIYNENSCDLKQSIFKFLKKLIISKLLQNSEKELNEDESNLLKHSYKKLIFSSNSVNSNKYQADDFYSKINLYIKELYFLSFADKNDIKIKVNEKLMEDKISILNFSSNILIYKDGDFLEFLVDLYINCNDELRKDSSINDQILTKVNFTSRVILKFLLDTEQNFNKYFFLTTKTTFCEKILSSISFQTTEIISYLFSCLIIIFSESFDNQYIPTKEFKSLMKNLTNKPNSKVFDEIQKYDLIVKNYKSLIEINSGELSKIVNSFGLFDFCNKIIADNIKVIINYLNLLCNNTLAREDCLYSIVFYIHIINSIIEIIDCMLNINHTQLTLIGEDNKSQNSHLKLKRRQSDNKLISLNNQFFNNNEQIYETINLLVNFSFHNGEFIKGISIDDKLLISSQMKESGYKLLTLCLKFDDKSNKTFEYIKQRFVTIKNEIEKFNDEACDTSLSLLCLYINEFNYISKCLFNQNDYSSLILYCKNESYSKLKELNLLSPLPSYLLGLFISKINFVEKENEDSIYEVIFLSIKCFIKSIIEYKSNRQISILKSQSQYIKKTEREYSIPNLCNNANLIELVMIPFLHLTHTNYFYEYIIFLINESFTEKIINFDIFSKNGDTNYIDDLEFKQELKLEYTYFLISILQFIHIEIESKKQNHELYLKLITIIRKILSNNAYNIKFFMDTNFFDILISILLLIDISEAIQSLVDIKFAILEILNYSFAYFDNNKIDLFFEYFEIELTRVSKSTASESKENIDLLEKYSDSNHAVDFLNKLLCYFSNSVKYSQKDPNGIILTSNPKISQENMFNQIYSYNIQLTNDNNIISQTQSKFNKQFHKSSDISSVIIKDKVSNKNFSILICFSLLKIEKNQNFKLLSMENSDYLLDFELISQEIFQDHTEMLFKILENNQQINTINVKISYNKNNRLLFCFKNKNLEITHNECALLNFNCGIRSIENFSLTSGFINNDISYNQNKYTIIKISYLMVYIDILSIEQLLNLKFADILVSKNGSAKKSQTDFKSLNSVRYKMFAPNFNFSIQKDKLQSIDLNIDPNKIVYELYLNPNETIDCIFNKELISQIRSDHDVCSLINNLNRKISNDIVKESIIFLIPNTHSIYFNNYNNAQNTQNTYNMSYLKDSPNKRKSSITGNYSNTYKSSSNYYLLNSTFLLSKSNNISKSSILSNEVNSNINNIYNSTTLKDIIKNKLKSFNQNLSYNLINSSSWINNLFTIINETTTTDVFNNTLLLIANILIGDISKLSSFTDGKLFRSFKLLLIKKGHIINEVSINILFSMTLGSLNFQENNFFNPLFPIYLYDILIDKDFFNSISVSNREYIIQNLILFLEQKKFTLIIHEGTFDVLVKLASFLFKILLLCENNLNNDENKEKTKSERSESFFTLIRSSTIINNIVTSNNMNVDNLICSLIVLILESVLKFKNGDIEPRSDHLIGLILSTQDFIMLSGNFYEEVNRHLMTSTKTSNIDPQSSLSLIKTTFTKLFSNKMQNIRDIILTNFRKTYQDISTQKAFSKINSKLQTLLSPSFFLKLYDKEIIKSEKMINEPINKNQIDQSDDWTIIRVNTKEHEEVLGTNKDLNYSEVVTNFNSDFECNGYSCAFCYFLNDNIKSIITFSQDYNIFKFSLIDSYKHYFLKGRYSLLNEKNISFSYYISKKEGLARIKNKLEPRLDFIKNEELNKKYYENFDNILLNDSLMIKSNVEKLFELPESYNTSSLLSKYLTIDRIFNLQTCSKLFSLDYFISGGSASNINLINYNTTNSLKPQEISHLKYLSGCNLYSLNSINSFKDSYFDIGKFIYATNCCIIEQLHSVESVLFIGTKKICFMRNCHLTSNKNILYSNDNNLKFSLGFWTTNDYKAELQSIDLAYDKNITNINILELNNFDSNKDFKRTNSNIRKITDDAKLKKFRRQENEFKITYINNSSITELHKRKYLLQNNAIEVFTRNGDNYLFVVNLDKRDKIFNIIVKYCTGYFDYTQELLSKYHNIFNTFANEIIIYLINSMSLTLFRSNSNTLMSKNHIALLISYLNVSYQSTKSSVCDSMMNQLYTTYSLSRNTINLNYSEFKYSNVNNNILQSNNSIFLGINNKLLFKRQKNCVITANEPGVVDSKYLLEEAINLWSRGYLLNFDYLMLLNTLSGRSYSDLSSYMIMPWILSDYTSDGLNLHNKDIYRQLNKPIHAHGIDVSQLIDKFSEADDEYKFHSGSHYSTSGFVCYFMIRSKPFAYISAEIQGGYFDMADRLFNNIKNIWSINDKFQELIPEMFYFPEGFINIHSFHFGVGQSNKKEVNDVILPLWTKNDSRLFTKMNKKSLESYMVSLNLCEWIDLIFGNKQYGREAVKSLNVFRQICYEGKVDLTKLNNKDKEDKLIEIRDFGQVPPLLFNKQHPKKEANGKITEFFARPSYLINFTIIEKPCLLTNLFNSKSKQSSYSSYSSIINTTNNFTQFDLNISPSKCSFYCESSIYQSYGTGGISSFNTLSDEDFLSKNSNNYNNTMLVYDNKKEYLFTKHLDFIDYGVSKSTFFVVSPLKNISYEFIFSKEIQCLKTCQEGKFTNLIIISFNDGSLELLRLHRTKYKIFMEEAKQEKSGFFSKMITNVVGLNKSMNKEYENLAKKESQQKSKITPPIKKSTDERKNTNQSSIDCYSDVVDFLIDTKNNNLINYYNEIEFPIIRYLEDDWKDIIIHYNQPGIELQKININKKGADYFFLQKLKTNDMFNDSIINIEISKAWANIIVVDSKNIVYILDLNTLAINKRIDLKQLLAINYKSKNTPNSHIFSSITSNLTNKKEKSIKIPFDFKSISQFDLSALNIISILIDDISGDFIILSSLYAFHFTLNGVIVSLLDITSDNYPNIFTISSGFVKSVFNTQSEIHLFTGHSDGSIYMWRLIPNLDNFYPDSANNFKYCLNNTFEVNCLKNPLVEFNIPYTYDNPFEFRSNNTSKVQVLKLSNDCSYMISIHENKMLQYWSYSSLFSKNKKVDTKLCPQCNSKMNNNQYVFCASCNKKICNSCKHEDIIPELSLKTKKSVCSDCLSMISSTNKMLYDF